MRPGSRICVCFDTVAMIVTGATQIKTSTVSINPAEKICLLLGSRHNAGASTLSG